MVMEYCEGGSVSDVMRLCRKKLLEDQIAAICACIVRGLAYLHSQKIFHRDIKGTNGFERGVGMPLELHCIYLLGASSSSSIDS